MASRTSSRTMEMQEGSWASHPMVLGEFFNGSSAGSETCPQRPVRERDAEISTGSKTVRHKRKAPSPPESHAILVGSKTSMVPTRLKEQSESRVVSASSKTAETTTHAKYRRRTVSFRPVPKPMPSVSAHGLAFRLRTSREKNRLRASTTLRRKASYRSPRASIPATAAVLNRILLQRASARGAPIAFRPIFPRSGQATGVASGRRPRPFLAAG
mgnify:CR=1 FL=1